MKGSRLLRDVWIMFPFRPYRAMCIRNPWINSAIPPMSASCHTEYTLITSTTGLFRWYKQLLSWATTICVATRHAHTHPIRRTVRLTNLMKHTCSKLSVSYKALPQNKKIFAVLEKTKAVEKRDSYLIDFAPFLLKRFISVEIISEQHCVLNYICKGQH